MMKISMPYYPEVSVNQAYRQSRRGGRFINNTARQWKLVLKTKTMRAIEDSDIRSIDGHKIIVELDARFPAQRGRRPDGDNFLKLAQDAIAAAFGVDDHIFLSRVRTVTHNSDEPGLDYEIRIEVD